MPPLLDSFEALLGPRLPEARFTAEAAIDGELPKSVDDHDVYILTGSPYGVYEDVPWIPPLEAFVREAVAADKVVIGGCFGHQLVAQALGGRVVKSDKGWGLGVHVHSLVNREPWMTGGPDAPHVVVSHQDQVIDPPPGAVVLATSDFCPNAMLRIGDRVLTLQGHPEMNLATVDRLLEMRRDGLSPEGYAASRASLDDPLAHDAFGDWIAGFIRQGVKSRAAA
ncbi:MAG: type 1 glutamine amidotransferase [Alphaproteobacteria bacterium]|nr:type 1 glutamine amidotransferase [Alphaproteobacteria bacterium]